MTWVLVKKFLRDIRLPLLVLWMLLFGFSVLWAKVAQRVTSEIAPFFTAVAKVSNINPKLFDEVIFKGPGRVSQSVLGGADVRFERPTDFLSMELMHPVILIMATVWGVGRAAGAIAGELERGTMELLLSQPIRRHQLVLAHFVVDLMVIPVLVSSIPLGTHAGLYLVGPFKVDYSVLDKLPVPPGGKAMLSKGPDVLEVDVAAQPYAAMHLIGLIFAVSGMTMAVSALGRSRWRVTGIAVMGMMSMFIINVLAQLWDAVAFLRPLSIFYYYQPQKVWLKGEWLIPPLEPWGVSGSVPMLAILLAIGFVGYVMAWRIFEKRDLPAPL